MSGRESGSKSEDVDDWKVFAKQEEKHKRQIRSLISACDKNLQYVLDPRDQEFYDEWKSHVEEYDRRTTPETTSTETNPEQSSQSSQAGAASGAASGASGAATSSATPSTGGAGGQQPGGSSPPPPQQQQQVAQVAIMPGGRSAEQNVHRRSRRRRHLRLHRCLLLSQHRRRGHQPLYTQTYRLCVNSLSAIKRSHAIRAVRLSLQQLQQCAP